MKKIFIVSALFVASLSAQSNVLAVYRLGPGVAQFGLALPKGAAHSVRIGDLPTQVDIKTRHDDGSLMFAVVNAIVPTEDNYEIRPENWAHTPLPTLTPWPTVVTELLVGGTRYLAPMPQLSTANPTDVWLSGPIASEMRTVVSARAGTTEHPSLRVRYDARQYFPTGRRLSATIENMIDSPETNLVSYDITIRVGGVARFTRTRVQHHSFSRWRPEPFLLDGLQMATVVPDFAPFYASRALLAPLVEGVPNIIRPMTGVIKNTDGTTTPKFDILQIGDLQPVQAAPGGRPEIGPYPAWVQEYLAHKRPEQLAYMLAMGGNVSGSWSMHITNPDDSSITLDNLKSPQPGPTVWTWGNGSGPLNKKVGRKFGPEAGSAHNPSLWFVPYLVTGDRFYLDEGRAWAHYIFMGWGPFGRNGREGLIYNQQTRGIGWASRDLSDFIRFSPDTDRDKPYFYEKLKNNLRRLDEQALVNKNPFGIRPTGSYLANTASTIQSQEPRWQNNYLAWGLHHVITDRGLGPEGSIMRERLLTNQLRLFTSDSACFRPEDATEYWYFVSKHEIGNPLFADLCEQWRYNYQDIDPSTGKTRKTPSVSILPGYAVDARLAILAALDLNMPGAKPAYDYIMAAKFAPTQGIPAGWAMLDDLRRRPEFALAPYPTLSVSPVPMRWTVTEEGQRLILERVPK